MSGGADGPRQYRAPPERACHPEAGRRRIRPQWRRARTETVPRRSRSVLARCGVRRATRGRPSDTAPTSSRIGLCPGGKGDSADERSRPELRIRSAPGHLLPAPQPPRAPRAPSPRPPVPRAPTHADAPAFCPRVATTTGSLVTCSLDRSRPPSALSTRAPSPAPSHLPTATGPLAPTHRHPIHPHPIPIPRKTRWSLPPSTVTDPLAPHTATTSVRSPSPGRQPARHRIRPLPIPRQGAGPPGPPRQPRRRYPQHMNDPPPEGRLPCPDTVKE